MVNEMYVKVMPLSEYNAMNAELASLRARVAELEHKVTVATQILEDVYFWIPKGSNSQADADRFFAWDLFHSKQK